MIAMRYLACAWGMGVLIAAGCSQPAPAPEPVRPVRALKVGDLKAIEGRQFPGRAKARDEVDLSFRVSGTLVELPVDVGSQVKQGDVIAAIDPSDFQNAVDSAQANLDQARANLLAMERGARPEEIEQLKAAVAEAKATSEQAIADFNRQAELLPKGATSRADYDIAVARRDRTAAQVKKAEEDLKIGQQGARPEDLEAKRSEIRALEAALANARNQVGYAVLKAPLDGQVAARYVDNYQTVQAKEPIVRLLDVSMIEVTVQVPESLISLVPRVKDASVRFDAFAGREFLGRVTKIGTEASQTTRTYPVTVEVDQPEDVRILPGMAAMVRGRPAEADVAAGQDIIVPSAAVFAAGSGQQSYVWVLEGGKKAVRRAVKTGKLTPVGMTVVEGLQPGEWVVTAGVHALREKQQVRILQEESR